MLSNLEHRPGVKPFPPRSTCCIVGYSERIKKMQRSVSWNELRIKRSSQCLHQTRHTNRMTLTAAWLDGESAISYRIRSSVGS